MVGKETENDTCLGRCLSEKSRHKQIVNVIDRHNYNLLTNTFIDWFGLIHYSAFSVAKAM